MTLPLSLDPDFLSNQVIPGDITVGEALAFVRRTPHGRFLESVGLTILMIYEDGSGVPSNETMANFRQLVLEGKATVAISDGSGGVPA